MNRSFNHIWEAPEHGLVDCAEVYCGEARGRGHFRDSTGCEEITYSIEPERFELGLNLIGSSKFSLATFLCKKLDIYPVLLVLIQHSYISLWYSGIYVFLTWTNSTNSRNSTDSTLYSK